jgi:hypothetical protein
MRGARLARMRGERHAQGLGTWRQQVGLLLPDTTRPRPTRGSQLDEAARGSRPRRSQQLNGGFFSDFGGWT